MQQARLRQEHLAQVRSWPILFHRTVRRGMHEEYITGFPKICITEAQHPTTVRLTCKDTLDRSSRIAPRNPNLKQRPSAWVWSFWRLMKMSVPAQIPVCDLLPPSLPWSDQCLPNIPRPLGRPAGHDRRGCWRRSWRQPMGCTRRSGVRQKTALPVSSRS